MASWPLAAASNWLPCANSSAVLPLTSPQLPKWVAEMAKTPDKPRLMSQSPATSSCVPRVGGLCSDGQFVPANNVPGGAVPLGERRREVSQGIQRILIQRRRLMVSSVLIPACLVTEKHDVSATRRTFHPQVLPSLQPLTGMESSRTSLYLALPGQNPPQCPDGE